MQDKAFQEGIDDGIMGICDPAKQRDSAYLEGVAVGMYNWSLFITSTVDHVGHRNSDRAVREVPLATAARLRSPLLKRGARSGHIPWAIPDLSDADGDTDREDEALAD